MTERYTAEEFMELVREIDEDGEGLTAWETQFIAGFIDRDEPLRDEDITARMCEKLDEIYDDRL